jgi:hypothetical protein
MPNLKHLTHGISNFVLLITKTKLGLSVAVFRSPVARSRWSTPRQREHGGNSRVGSRMDAGVVAIREESDRDFFYFVQREMGASVRMAVLGHSGGCRGLPTRVRAKRMPYP